MAAATLTCEATSCTKRTRTFYNESMYFSRNLNLTIFVNKRHCTAEKVQGLYTGTIVALLGSVACRMRCSYGQMTAHNGTFLRQRDRCFRNADFSLRCVACRPDQITKYDRNVYRLSASLVRDVLDGVAGNIF